MLKPVKIFTAPNDTTLRLYKQNDFYYLPVVDIGLAIGYKNNPSASSGVFADIIQQNYKKKTIYRSLRNEASSKLIETVAAKKALLDFAKRTTNIYYETNAKRIKNIIAKVIIPFTKNYTPIEDDDAEENFELEPMGAKENFELEPMGAKENFELEPMGAKEEIETVKTVKVPPSYNELEEKIAMLEAELKKAKAGTKKTIQLVFGERVSAEMKKRQWGLGDLAKFSGINSGTLAHATNGERALKLDDAASVADALEVSLDYLCGREV